MTPAEPIDTAQFCRWYDSGHRTGREIGPPQVLRDVQDLCAEIDRLRAELSEQRLRLRLLRTLEAETLSRAEAALATARADGAKLAAVRGLCDLGDWHSVKDLRAVRAVLDGRTS